MGMVNHSTHLCQPLLLLRLQLWELVGPRPLPDVSEGGGSVCAQISRSTEYRRIRGTADNARQGWSRYGFGKFLAIGVRYDPRDGQSAGTDVVSHCSKIDF